jgi:hybrid cluster-associated redox disulfide protein
MNYPAELFPQMIVADLLDQCPECIPWFLGKRMLCVGCLMARFDTLSDVAQNYGLTVDGMLAELRGVVKSLSEGASHV